MTAEEDAAAIAQAARDMTLALPNGVAERLVRFIDLLVRWNATYNLTAVRDREGMRLQHVNDCLAVVNPVRRELSASPLLVLSGRRRVLDVGSGGGLPGVVLALSLPEIDVVCVDSVGKKAAFVQQAALELDLRNLRAVHTRVERCDEPGFDIVTSRAFASLHDFCQLTSALLAPQGCWMAMKAKVTADEVGALPINVQVFHVEQLSVPGLDAQRCAVWMRPVSGAV